MAVLNGTIDEWAQGEDGLWRRIDHPEDGVINIGEADFAAYYAKRQQNVTDEAAKIARKAELEALPEHVDLLNRLKTATPAQIDTWLTNNVTTLAQARTVLGTMLKYMATRM